MCGREVGQSSLASVVKLALHLPPGPRVPLEPSNIQSTIQDSHSAKDLTLLPFPSLLLSLCPLFTNPLLPSSSLFFLLSFSPFSHSSPSSSVYFFHLSDPGSLFFPISPSSSSLYLFILSQEVGTYCEVKLHSKAVEWSRVAWL